MLREDVKRKSLITFFCFVLLAFQSGIKTSAIVFTVIFGAGLVLTTIVWLFAFILVAVIDKSISSAWNYVHPVTMFKECFYEQKGEKDEVRD